MVDAKKMSILGIVGSPRRGGNTEILVDEALAGAKEAGHSAEKIILSQHDINPCDACNACMKTGSCIHDDDFPMTRQARMQSSDPTNAAIKSSNDTFNSPKPKSTPNNQKRKPPISAPAIPTATFVHSPNPDLLKVTSRPASVPAKAPMISQTISFPTIISQLSWFTATWV